MSDTKNMKLFALSSNQEIAQRIADAAGVEKGSGTPNKTKVATVTRAQVQEIAETKMPDLNAANIESAMRMIEGTARSMGFTVVD